MPDKDKEEELKRREAEVAERERRVKEREESRVESASVGEQIEEALARQKGMRGGGGLNLTSIIINVVLSVIVAYVLVGYVGITKGWFNTNIAPALNSFANTYATKAELGNYVIKSDFSNYATKTDLDAYLLKANLPASPDLSGYISRAEYDALVARVAELETTDGGGVTVGETTRWSLDVLLDRSLPSGVILSNVSTMPTRIEETDTYRIYVTFANSSLTDDRAVTVGMSVVLIPKSKDTVVDTENTFLDPVTSPYIDWDCSFSPSPDENDRSVNCRRVEFTSVDLVSFTVPKATGETAPGTFTYQMDLELTYAE